MNDAYDDGFPRGEAVQRRESAIGAMLSQLDKQLGELQHAVDTLVVRVESVTQPSSPRPEVASRVGHDEPALDRPISHVVARLHDIGNVINRMSNGVRDVIDRLDT